jgi:hypothetical protein
VRRRLEPRIFADAYRLSQIDPSLSAAIRENPRFLLLRFRGRNDDHSWWRKAELLEGGAFADIEQAGAYSVFHAGGLDGAGVWIVTYRSVSIPYPERPSDYLH